MRINSLRLLKLKSRPNFRAVLRYKQIPEYEKSLSVLRKNSRQKF